MMCLVVIESLVMYHEIISFEHFADARAIKENCLKLGAGDDLYPLFAGVLTTRPWERVVYSSVDHLALQGDDRDRSEIQVTSVGINTRWGLLMASISEDTGEETPLQVR